MKIDKRTFIILIITIFIVITSIHIFFPLKLVIYYDDCTHEDHKFTYISNTSYFEDYVSTGILAKHVYTDKLNFGKNSFVIEIDTFKKEINSFLIKDQYLLLFYCPSSNGISYEMRYTQPIFE
jgi:hypothetical protein